MKRLTYYIGLHAPTSTNDAASVTERRTIALDLLAGAYDALTVADVTGMWEGVEEPSLRVEVIIGETDYEDAGFTRDEQAHEIARDLALALDQDAVGLSIEPIEFHIIKQD